MRPESSGSFGSSSASLGVPPQQAKTGLVGGPGAAQDFTCGLSLHSRPAKRLKLLKFCKFAFPQDRESRGLPVFLGVLTVFPGCSPPRFIWF